jgi:hypothetical protein
MRCRSASISFLPSALLVGVDMASSQDTTESGFTDFGGGFGILCRKACWFDSPPSAIGKPAAS